MFAKLEKLFKRFAYLNRKDYFCTRFICRGSVAQLDQSNSLLSCGSWVRIPTESPLQGKRILETKFSFLFIDSQLVSAYREVYLSVCMRDSKNKNGIFMLHTTYVTSNGGFWKSHTNLTHPGKYFRPSKVKIMRPTSPK